MKIKRKRLPLSECYERLALLVADRACEARSIETFRLESKKFHQLLETSDKLYEKEKRCT